MESIRQAVVCTLGFCALSSFALAGDQPHWTYSGSHGPAHWGDLAPEYVQCKVGVNQSPVDITHTIDAELLPLRLDYHGATTEVINNGHTVQINVEPGNTLQVDGDVFELQQFHFHAPSEHRFKGESFLMELHIVHANSRGELAVIGVLFEPGETNPKLAQLGDVIPEAVNEPAPLSVPLADLGFVDEVDTYYRYNGSLTTPPCSEGVRWFVLAESRTISRERQQAFIELIGEDARGPQPLNARVILN
jgi:carbonic anhydrase